jgi:hypothetical protein
VAHTTAREPATGEAALDWPVSRFQARRWRRCRLHQHDVFGRCGPGAASALGVLQPRAPRPQRLPPPRHPVAPRCPHLPSSSSTGGAAGEKARRRARQNGTALAQGGGRDAAESFLVLAPRTEPLPPRSRSVWVSSSSITR